MATSELLPRQILAPLTRRSDIRGLGQFLSHLAALAITAALVNLADGSWWLLLPALWLHGMVLVFLFAPAHECIHYTAFRSRWLNRVVATFCGFLLVLPPRYFRAFHLAHHRYTQDPIRDPELARAKPTERRSYLWHISGIPYWRGQFATLWRHARGLVSEPFVPAGEQAALVREARLFWLGYGLVAALSVLSGSTAALYYWVIPVLLGQPLLRLYLLAEHTGCPEVGDMLGNTRTTLSNPLLRWLAWNMPYHTEHHVAAAVPFHQLPALHRLLRGRVVVLTPGYLEFHRQWWHERYGEPA